jgi:hypothetical protein
MDFSRGDDDYIDLRNIDADTTYNGNQAFDLLDPVGSAAKQANCASPPTEFSMAMSMAMAFPTSKSRSQIFSRCMKATLCFNA